MTSMVISSVSHKQLSTTAHGQRPRAAGERQARQEDAQQAQPRWRPQHGQGHRGRSVTPLSLPSSAGACSRICPVLLSSALHQTASPSPLLISSPSPARLHSASRRSRRPSGFKLNCSRRRIYLHRAAMRCATLAPSGTSMTPPSSSSCAMRERRKNGKENRNWNQSSPRDDEHENMVFSDEH